VISKNPDFGAGMKIFYHRPVISFMMGSIEMCRLRSILQLSIERLPSDLQTFRDLAVLIANLDCEAVWGSNMKTNSAGKGLT
tara:strand:- start:35759 stop:36004 length:246 start_codon:yes stop_codon:yes gene_type:complete